ANARIAPTGRNHAIAHGPGPGPSVSRARLVTLVVPTRDPRPAPPPESSVGTNGNSNTAAAARARPSSERPSTRDRPATRLTRTTTAMGRTIPGRNATPIAIVTPRPATNRHPPPGGASGPKATSRRSVAAGSTARQTRRSSRPSDKAHRTIADSPYATAAITAGPGRRVRRIAARYITTAARAGAPPRMTFCASDVLANSTDDSAPRPPSAGLAARVPPRPVVR